MKRLFLALLCCASLPACAQQPADPAATAKPTPAVATPARAAEPTYAAGTPEARVRAVLNTLNSRIEVDRIDPAPFPGFRQVVAGGQVVYVSDDGKYLVQGQVLDVASRTDLSEAAMARVRAGVLETLPMAERIVFPAQGETKHRIVVLTDVECGYCRKFHEEIAEHAKRGIEVQYLAFPRAGLGSEDYRKMVSVWCAPDRRKALTDAKAGRNVPTRTCTTPVDRQYNAGKRMGLEGTPMILTEQGEFVGGYLAPDLLVQRLEQVAAERAGSAPKPGG